MATVAPRDPSEQPAPEACDHRGEVLEHRAWIQHLETTTAAPCLVPNPRDAEWLCGRCLTWLDADAVAGSLAADWIDALDDHGPLFELLLRDQPDDAPSFERKTVNALLEQAGSAVRICESCGAPAERQWRNGAWLCVEDYGYERGALDQEEWDETHARRTTPLIPPPAAPVSPGGRISGADRVRIATLSADLVVARLSAPPPSPPNRGGAPAGRNADRDAWIRARAAEGEGPAAICNRLKQQSQFVHVGRERVKQIIREGKHRGN